MDIIFNCLFRYICMETNVFSPVEPADHQRLHLNEGKTNL